MNQKRVSDFQDFSCLLWILTVHVQCKYWDVLVIDFVGFAAFLTLLWSELWSRFWLVICWCKRIWVRDSVWGGLTRLTEHYSPRTNLALMCPYTTLLLQRSTSVQYLSLMFPYYIALLFKLSWQVQYLSMMFPLIALLFQLSIQVRCYIISLLLYT